MIKINTDHTPAEKALRKPRILVAPLDWGLGHATRCIPVIYALIRQNVEVWVATDGAQEALLKKEFPELRFLTLTGYRVKYGRTPKRLIRRILFQLPGLYLTIKKEHNWLKKAINQYGFDAVISDNRYGLYHSSVPCVFITHQLAIKSPLGKWAERLLQRMNYKFINRFTCCWIPDQEKDSLARELSHPLKKPTTPVYYVGFLSRLVSTGQAERKHHLFISLSGPEPQRTLFENKIVNEISHYNGTATIVRGLPGVQSLIPSTNDIKFYNHLPTDEYNKEMEQAEFVISRSGYSTIMDIVHLRKRAFLIPTPGQTEQEYLAKYLEQIQLACWCGQQDFSLKKMIETVESFPFRFIDIEEGRLGETVRELLRLTTATHGSESF